MKADSDDRSVVLAGAVFCVAMCIASALAWWSESLRSEQRRGEVSVLAANHANTLQRNIERALSSTYALAALVRQAGGDVRDFETIAAEMLPYYQGASALSLAPAGVVSRIVPLAGNEKAIGHDLMADPQRDKEAIRARDTGKLTLAGPFELRQGGVAAAGRLPVFLERNDGTQQFWGLVTVLIRFPEVLAPANLPQLVELGYDYELSRVHPDTGRKHVIAASVAALSPLPVEQTVAVPNATWTLAVAPQAGWNEPASLLLKLALGLLISLSLAGLAGLMVQLKRNRDELELRVQQRTAELELARDAAETANRAKSSFLANISHELRTPLNGILGMADLAFGAELSQGQRKRVGIIRDSGLRLLRIINDLIEFSRLEAGTARLERVEFDLADVLEALRREIAPAAAAKQLAWSIDCPPEVPRLLSGDPQRLQQVLLNYAENAVKFTASGEVLLSVELLARTAATVQLRFAVRDTGIGLSHEEMARLFAGFVQIDDSSTRKYGGTGLGLAIARQLARLMGGSVGVDSVKGRGSSFFFTAAFALPEPAAQTTAASASTPTPALPAPPAAVDAARLRSVCRALALLIEQSDIAATTHFDRHAAMLAAVAPAEAARIGSALAEFDFDRAAAALHELMQRAAIDP